MGQKSAQKMRKCQMDLCRSTYVVIIQARNLLETVLPAIIGTLLGLLTQFRAVVVSKRHALGHQPVVSLTFCGAGSPILGLDTTQGACLRQCLRSGLLLHLHHLG